MQGIWLLRRGVWEFMILNLLVAIAYAIGVNLSHQFATLPATVASVWFPSGLTLALVFWLGKRPILGIICGSTFALTLGLSKSIPSLSVFSLALILIACACGNVLQPLFANYVIKKFSPYQNIFSHVSTVVLYIAAAISAPMISATFGISSLCITGIIPWHSYTGSWLTWWLASALPHLIFTPTFLLWKDFHKNSQQRNIWEISLLLSIILLISWIAFAQSYPLAYLLLPILLWTVFRFGNFPASLLVSLVSLIAILSTSQGHGLYVKDSPNQSLLLLQSFMAVFSLTSLILSAVLDERIAAQLSLKKTMENLEELVIERTIELQLSEAQLSAFFTSAPVGMGIVDHQLRHVQVNQVLTEISKKTMEEHLNRTVAEILGEFSFDIEPYLQQVLKTGRPLLNQEISSNLLSTTGQTQTWLASYFPIFDRDNMPSRVGFVVIDISDRKKAEADMQYAESMLRRANLELEKLVNIDGLTQVANRRCFDERIVLEWERLCREHEPLSLLLFDIDYFKLYNDCYGHQMGDDCLTAIAQTVEKVLHRPADLVARYGGEEFTVILPNTDIHGAAIVAEQIRGAIIALNIPHQNSNISNIVTISIGIASLLPNNIQEPSLLIKQADIALYRAKKQGRNQFFIFTE